MKKKDLSPGRKGQYTAKWARTMTKWLITFSRRHGARWNLVDFGGKTKAESRGIVDLMALRKDHQSENLGLERGDLFEIILIQTKGGSARHPTPEDVSRLSKVAKHHRAKAVVLATWQRGKILELAKLKGTKWSSVSPKDVFG
jgi:hypothetical protein